MRASMGSVMCKVCFAALGALASLGVAAKGEPFDFTDQLFGPPRTLLVNIESIDPDTGYVFVNGVDTQCPTIPFTWDWGDDIVHDGWFPQEHTYADVNRNYILTVTAHYGGGETDSVQVLVRFVAPTIDPIPLPPELAVTIPDSDVTLGSHMPGYYPPSDLTYFPDSLFSSMPRSAIEYVLSVAATIQRNFAIDNMFRVDDAFEQLVMRDPDLAGGMYSLWFTNPVSFAAGDTAVQGSIPYSSFMHEMGHNFTLNMPADYFYGGKIDGCANAIYSESMAQIFQHAAAYEIINHAEDYGLDEELTLEIKNSATASMMVVRNAYDDYVDGGMVFHSWNDPGTPEDETFDTSMTIAYKFFEHAENSGQGYRIPLKRMCYLLQLFDAEMEARYNQHHNTPEADEFRATLMVAGVSRGFQTDLRPEFTALNFPIDDTTFEDLVAAAEMPGDADDDMDVDLGDLGILLAAYNTCAGDPDYNPAANFADDNDCIDLADLGVLLANYGTGVY